MPRKNTNSVNKRKYKNYDKDDMQKAVAEFKEGKGSCKLIAARYGINRTTLLNHIKNFKCQAVGHPTVLSLAEEELLVHSLVKLGEWGFGFNRLQLQVCVQDYLTRLDRPNPFKNNLPGIDWCKAFERRWKSDISMRVAQNLPKNRAAAGSSEIIEHFYETLLSILTKYDLLNKPQNIYNCDETGFQTDAGVQKILCRRGSRNPVKLVGNTTKTMYTVLMACSAVGEFLPMYILYKGLHLYSSWCIGGPDGARYNCSPSGWMESAQFLEWFVNSFIPGTSHLEGMKLLIFDGHNSHVSIELIDKARENNIELLCLPAHTSHLFQPLDVGVYKAVKQAWRNILREFYQSSGYKCVDKLIFPSLMKKLDESGCLSRANAIGGFEGSGISPLSLEKMKIKVTTASLVDQNAPTTNSSTPIYNPELPAVNIIPNDGSAEQLSDLPATRAAIDVSSEIQLSPKKQLELALLTALKSKSSLQVPNAKRTKLSRKFAESLTSEEVKNRINENKRKKSTQQKKGKRSQGNKLKQKKMQKKIIRHQNESSSSNSEISVHLESEDDIVSDMCDEIDTEVGSSSNREKELWVLVKFYPPKGEICYVGKVLEDNNDSLKVDFLRKKGVYFTFPDVRDTTEINKNDIISNMEKILESRGRYYFKFTKVEEGLTIY